MEEKRILFEWVVPESDRDEVSREIEAAGGTVEISGDPYTPSPDDPLTLPGSSFEPLVVIAGAVASVYMIREIAKLWRDIKDKGGEIIDARGGKLRRRRIPSLDRRTLILFTDEGKSVYRPHEEDVCHDGCCRDRCRSSPTGDGPAPHG